MSRLQNKLKPLAVEKEQRPGTYNDGGGLNLQIGPTGGKSWLFRYMYDGKAKNLGLGAVHTISLKEARERAHQCRLLLSQRKDPKVERDLQTAKIKAANAHAMSFRECADAYIEVKRPTWKNAKHGEQWENTLRDYAHPVMGDMPVSEIDTTIVLKCLQGIWTTKTETASRLRGRIESILDWATTGKYREGENPARWRGHLEHLLPAPNRVKKVIHHPALPYQEIAAFMKDLSAIENSTSAQSLKFLILTATRTSETLGARWDEFDLERAIWTIPAERMKAKREFRVLLSSRALEMVNEMKSKNTSDYVFPGARHGKPLSNMSLLMLLRRMNRDDLTVHGFRSTFRDWASEVSSHPHEVAEMALAHAVSDKVELAYRRGDLLEKRRALMRDWEDYCYPVKIDLTRPNA